MNKQDFEGIYCSEEIEKIREKAEDPASSYTGVNMSLGFALYESLMYAVNELHQIRESMESIEKIISEQQNR